jgi:Lon-like protease
MLAADAVPTLGPADELADVMERGDEAIGRFVVVDHDRVVGILSRSDLVRVLEIARAQGPSEPAPTAEARRVGIGVWIVVGLIIALAAGFLYRPPLAVVGPAEAIDLTDDISITGVDTTPVEGRVLATPVRVSQTTALGTIVAYFDPDREVVPISAIVPEGVDPGGVTREREAQLQESQLLAAAVAADAAGLDVQVDGSGAQVLRVLEGAPAERALETGDVIVGIDGQPVRLAADLRDIVGARAAGTSFTFSIERTGQRIEATIESTRLQRGLEEVTGIGVIAETRGLVVDLPFEVTFRERAAGGPSAGLAYALLITDLLTPDDLLDGQTIAATGTVDLEGNVGPVGGLPGKVVSAREGGAELFLVPLGDEVGAGEDDGMRIVPVGTLDEALARVGGTLAA